MSRALADFKGFYLLEIWLDTLTYSDFIILLFRDAFLKLILKWLLFSHTIPTYVTLYTSI